LSEIAGDMGGLVGGDFVNRFDILGTQLQGDSPDPEDRSTQSRPAQGCPCHWSERQTRPTAAPSPPCANRRTRSLNRFPATERGQVSAVAIRPLDEALRYLEDEAGKILPKGSHRLHRGVPPVANRGGTVPPGVQPCCHSDLPGTGGPVHSFRDPFVILTGSVPLAHVRRPALHLS